jgi:hypothetical protein
MKTQINTILQTFSEFVSTHDYVDTPVLTAYVDVDPGKAENQRQQPAWEIELKNEARRLAEEEELAPLKRRLEPGQWERAEEMLSRELRGRKLGGRSVVVFSDLTDSISVDLPVEMPTRLYYGIPQVRHLLFALDQHKKYLVVLLSGDEARVAEVFLTRHTDEIRIETGHERMRRVGPKASTLAKKRRDAEYERRVVADVAAAINRYFLGDPDFERIVLGGNARQAHAVANLLHPAVAELLVSIEPIDFKAAEQDIAAAVRAVADAYEADHDMTVVEGLISTFNRHGPAAVEQRSVELALEQGRVRSLVLPYPIAADEFDPLIVQATANGASVEFVTGPAADRLGELGGVGAKLYFA